MLFPACDFAGHAKKLYSYIPKCCLGLQYCKNIELTREEIAIERVLGLDELPLPLEQLVQCLDGGEGIDVQFFQFIQ